MQVSDLKANKRNPRTISKEKREMLKKAIEEFGDLGGVVFNRQTKQLVGGHQRISVLPKGSKVVIENTYDPPTRTGTVADGHILISDERFMYREVDWPLVREESANIAANQHGGSWQDDKLREILADLVSAGIDMDLVGFTTDELAKLMGSAAAYDAQCDEDEAPEPPKNPRTVTGDVYHLGPHKLLCGDSTRVDDVEKLMAGEKADMIFTDPPYNVAYEGGTGLTIQNDSMGDDAFYKFLYDAYTNMLMHTKPGGAIYVAHADSEGANFRLAMKKAGWLLKQCIIWNKSSLVMGRQDYHWKHEPISTVGRRGLGTIGTQTESRQPWWSLINPPETASTRR
jgi:hypothetical protein